MDPENTGDTSSSSHKSKQSVEKKPKHVKRKKRKPNFCQRGGHFPLEVVVNSLEKLPEYFNLQHKTKDASEMTEDEQRNFTYIFKKKKLWEDLQLLKDKSRSRDYISKRADQLRKRHNSSEVKNLVAGKLYELKFSTTIIKSYHSDFKIPTQIIDSASTISTTPTETIESAPTATVATTSPTSATITTTTVTSSTFTTASSPTTTTETLSPTPVTTITTPSLPPSQTATTNTTTTPTLSPAKTTTTTPTLSPSPTTTTKSTTPSSSPSQIETTNTTTTPTLSPTTATNTPTPSSSPSPTTNTSTPPSRAAQIKINKNVPLIQNSTSSSTSILNDSTIHIPQETKTVSGIVGPEISPAAPERRLNGDSPEFQSLEMMSQDKNTNEDDNSSNQNFLDSYYSFHDSDSDTADQNSGLDDDQKLKLSTEIEEKIVKDRANVDDLNKQEPQDQVDDFYVDLSSQNSDYFGTSQQIILQIHDDDDSSNNSGGGSGQHNFHDDKIKIQENMSHASSDDVEKSLHSSDLEILFNSSYIEANASQKSGDLTEDENQQSETTPYEKTSNHGNPESNSKESSILKVATDKAVHNNNNDNINESSVLMGHSEIKNNDDDDNLLHPNPILTPFTVSMFGNLVNGLNTDITTWNSIQNFSSLNDKEMISLGVELITNQTSINKQVEGIISCVFIHHWIFIEIDLMTNVILIHDPDVSNTPPDCLRKLLDKLEEFLDEQRRPSARQRQILDGSEEASRLELESGEFCLKLLRDGFKTLKQAQAPVSVIKATTSNLNEDDSLKYNAINNDAVHKIEPEDSNTNTSPILVIKKCCEMLEETSVSCYLCKINLHEDCAVYLGSIAEGFDYYCLSCEKVKISKENSSSPKPTNATDKKEGSPSTRQETTKDETEHNNKSSFSSENREEQLECLISAQDICEVLCVNKSAVNYSLPLSFSVILSKAEVSEMFSFQRSMSNEGVEITQVSFNSNSWASTLSEAFSRSEIPCSFSATHTPFFCRFVDEKKHKNSNQKVTSNFAHAYGKCSGQCDIKFTVIFPQKPQAGCSLKVEIKTKGKFKLEQDQTTARRISGTERSKVKGMLKNYKSNKVYLDRVSHLSALHLLHQNKKAMTPAVLRNAKWEEKTEKRSDKNECQDLENILMDQKKTIYPDSDLPGYLRHLTTVDNFQYELYCFPQVKLTNILAQKAQVWLTIDASSRIARRPNEEKLQKKAVFNYIMDVSVDGVQPYTVAELVTTNNRSSNIKSFMTRVLDEVKKAGQYLPKVVTGVISDMSMALIHASCESINVETFKSYIQRSYKVVKNQEKPQNNKSIICVCSNHTLSAFLKNVKKRSLNKDVKKVSMSILARIMEARDLDDLNYYARRAIRILGCKFLDESILKSYIDDVTVKNLENFEAIDEEIDVHDFEQEVLEFDIQNEMGNNNSEAANREEQINPASGSQQQQLNPDSSTNQEKERKVKQNYSVLRSENNFYRDFVQIRKECCPDLPEVLNPKLIDNYLKSHKISKTKEKNENQLELAEETVESSDTENPYFSLKVLELLENYYIPMLPFIGAMVPRNSGFPSFLRRTNAVNESSFKINKNEWHLVRNMHNGDFIREHFDLIHGKIKDVMSNVNKNRKKLQVPLVSLKCAVGETKSKKTGPLDDLECHQAVENWGGQGDVKVKSKVKKEPKHLSSLDKLNENQSKRMTRSQKNTEKDGDEIIVEDIPSAPEVTEVILGSSSHGNIIDSDVQCLFKGHLWLSSDLMNEFAYILCDKYDSFPSRKKCLGILDILPSYAIIKTKTGELAQNLAFFQRLSENSDTIFFPLNMDDAHWIFVKLEKIQTEKRGIYVFDSKPAFTSTSQLKKIIKIITNAIDAKFGTKPWDEIKFMKTTNQRNGYNCGPSTLLLMDLHITGDDQRKYESKYLSYYRMEILKKILKTTTTGKNILKRCKTDEILKNFVLEKKDEMLKIQKTANSK